MEEQKKIKPNKPSIPSGTRDFSPLEMVRRNYIFDSIRRVFQKYGYMPIETPAMENLSTLMGKYGDEGDKLIFKILESGEYTTSFNENIISKFTGIIQEEETADKFKAIAEEFADQVNDFISNYNGLSKFQLADNLLRNLSSDEFLKNTYRPDFWYNFKKVFVDYVVARQYLFTNEDVETRKKELRTRFKNLVNSSSKLREIIRIETFTREQFKPSNLNNFISKKALRYDLTVPFARYVVQHQSEIVFPFKRYQIQPVWRADRPQKGRYREFYQCDADVIGSNSLINEVELIQIMDEVFAALKIPVIIKINNRKILSGLAEVIGEKDKIIAITVAMDKLDKIGLDGVNKELRENGISELAIERLQPLLTFKGHQFEKVSFLNELLANSEVGRKGMEEIETIFSGVNFVFENRSVVREMELGNIDIPYNTSSIELDLTLARGLNYYTGAIFEVKANTEKFTSSICGGGRYDDLTGIFGLPNVSGVGISFGADRIYDVLNELNLFPEINSALTKLLFVTSSKKDQKDCMPLISRIRGAGINAEIYPDPEVNLKKQFTYGEIKKIPYVILIGSEGVNQESLVLKNIISGEKNEMSIDNIIEKLKYSL